MNIQVAFSSYQLAKLDISLFEQRIGAPLPQDYKSFLLQHNGGTLKPNYVEIPSLGTGVLVDMLYSIEAERQLCDIEFETYRLREYLEQSLLVIGHDPGGNSFLISVSGDDNGSIYFWDKRELLKNGTIANTFIIADSFAGFLESIKSMPE